jgi:hypothetical protein
MSFRSRKTDADAIDSGTAYSYFIIKEAARIGVLRKAPK